MDKNIGCSWSGGKDSCFALMQAMAQDMQPVALINMMNENGKISRSHGLPQHILAQQAAAMQLPLLTSAASWLDYEQHFVAALQTIRQEYGARAIVFGDIDLQAHRDWEEMVCNKARLKAILPIWQQERKTLVLQMIDAGIEAIIVSCNEILGKEFLGKQISRDLLPLLEAKAVDVCGENGEFHTLVTNCPLFKTPVKLPSYNTVLHDGYWFIQWANEPA